MTQKQKSKPSNKHQQHKRHQHQQIFAWEPSPFVATVLKQQQQQKSSKKLLPNNQRRQTVHSDIVNSATFLPYERGRGVRRTVLDPICNIDNADRSRSKSRSVSRGRHSEHHQALSKAGSGDNLPLQSDPGSPFIYPDWWGHEEHNPEPTTQLRRPKITGKITAIEKPTLLKPSVFIVDPKDHNHNSNMKNTSSIKPQHTSLTSKDAAISEDEGLGFDDSGEESEPSEIVTPKRFSFPKRMIDEFTQTMDDPYAHPPRPATNKPQIKYYHQGTSATSHTTIDSVLTGKPAAPPRLSMLQAPSMTSLLDAYSEKKPDGGGDSSGSETRELLTTLSSTYETTTTSMPIPRNNNFRGIPDPFKLQPQGSWFENRSITNRNRSDSESAASVKVEFSAERFPLLSPASSRSHPLNPLDLNPTSKNIHPSWTLPNAIETTPTQPFYESSPQQIIPNVTEIEPPQSVMAELHSNVHPSWTLPIKSNTDGTEEPGFVEMGTGKSTAFIIPIDRSGNIREMQPYVSKVVGGNLDSDKVTWRERVFSKEQSGTLNNGRGVQKDWDTTSTVRPLAPFSGQTLREVINAGEHEAPISVATSQKAPVNQKQARHLKAEPTSLTRAIHGLSLQNDVRPFPIAKVCSSFLNGPVAQMLDLSMLHQK